MKSFYHLVKLFKSEFPNNDYEFIHLAFDDANGLPLHSRTLDKNFLQHSLNTPNGYYDFEEMFLANEKPHRMVLWAYSNERGWCERKEELVP